MQEGDASVFVGGSGFPGKGGFSGKSGFSFSTSASSTPLSPPRIVHVDLNDSEPWPLDDKSASVSTDNLGNLRRYYQHQEIKNHGEFARVCAAVTHQAATNVCIVVWEPVKDMSAETSAQKDK
jgi:hypothetical protein